MVWLISGQCQLNFYRVMELMFGGNSLVLASPSRRAKKLATFLPHIFKCTLSKNVLGVLIDWDGMVQHM